MLPFANSRPQKKTLIADAVKEKMARVQQAAASKASSSPQPPSVTMKRKDTKLSRDDSFIDLTSDDHDHLPPTVNTKVPRLISPQGPVGYQPQTPHRTSPYSPLESLHGPTIMPPSLLQSALNAASPKSPVESPRSPLEKVSNGKRKRELSPPISLGSPTIESSPRSPVEEEDGPKRRRQGEASPYFARASSTHVLSPRSPVEEVPARSVPTAAVVESPRSPVEETAPSQQRARTANTGLATPDQTPQKQKDIITTETADRFAPVTIDGVEYRNPAKFSLNPPYWQRWDSKTYVKFAEHLRWQFNPVPFSKETGVPVEEITHVFNAVVCNPLYFPKKALKRGEAGMEAIMKLYGVAKSATVARPWGKEDHEGGGKRLLGELTGVARGEVQLILGQSGNKKVLGLEKLGDKDVKYLRDNLSEGDKKILWSQ